MLKILRFRIFHRFNNILDIFVLQLCNFIILFEFFFFCILHSKKLCRKRRLITLDYGSQASLFQIS
jgi:hypothetical protein